MILLRFSWYDVLYRGATLHVSLKASIVGAAFHFSPRQRSGYGLVETLHLRLSTAPMPMAAGGGVLREGGASDSM